MADASPKQQIVDKINDSSNILVTVNANPTVDQLAAALGITLLIDKLDKHGTAVFSGAVPSAMGFLSPEKTFEGTVDSLRDFIIALSKDKADHLRYKVVDDMVKIFITPYRTTISQDDLDFSQGDYNVEFILAIGVEREKDLDKALESHGRILHDATVATISLGESSKLGGIEWTDGKASSYSEMLASLVELFKADKKLLDEQIANAFLTGIVAATNRFSNDKTSSQSMTIAAQLMAAGANQQLIASHLQDSNEIPTPSRNTDDKGNLVEGKNTKLSNIEEAVKKPKKSDNTDGGLSILHVPKGTIDEVAVQVAEQHAAEATSEAEAELAKQTETKAAEKQADAAELAERKLSEELNAAHSDSQQPSHDSVQRDLASINTAAAEAPAAQGPLRGAVAMDQWKARTEDEAKEPSLGGTLNATSEQAAEDKRREIADDRNRTILSHGAAGGYATETPSFQSPLNATVSFGVPQNSEPEVRDIFAEGNGTEMTAHVDAIQPPAPSAPAPTLAEIDAQNIEKHNDAIEAVNQALGAPMAGTAPTPSTGLPPLPPMPDFSTLPPLPGVPSPGTTSVPDALGAILPPSDAPVVPPPINVDPNQFRIPGQ